MNKLFLRFILLISTISAPQIIKPMEQIEPPQTLLIKPNFQCTLISKTQQANMIQLEYKIDIPNKKLSPLSPANSFDITFVTLTFTPYTDTTDATCVLKNISVSDERQVTTTFSQILLNSGIIDGKLFTTQEFNRPKIIKYLIEIAFSIYFREHIINSQTCVLCLKKIKNNRAIMLLNCGKIMHKKCYLEHAEEIICPTCSKIMTEDIWYKLKALPKKNSF